MSKDKLVVTVSVTRGIESADAPYLPITPKQIADSAIDARKAGGLGCPYSCEKILKPLISPWILICIRKYLTISGIIQIF